MLDYVYGQNEIVAPAVAQLIPHCRRGWGPNVHDDWRGRRRADDRRHRLSQLGAGAGIIEISGAALPGHYWMTRETFRQMYQYPFLVCGCQMVVQRTPAEDERLLYMLLRYDYTLHRIPRLFGRDRTA